MIFETGELPKLYHSVSSGEPCIGCEELADCTWAIDANGFAVEKSESAAARTGGIGECMAEYLHTGANRKNDRAFVDSAVEPLTLVEFASGLHLRSVLAATYEVQVGGIGYWCSSVDGDVFNLNAAPFKAT